MLQGMGLGLKGRVSLQGPAAGAEVRERKPKGGWEEREGGWPFACEECGFCDVILAQSLCQCFNSCGLVSTL